MIVSCFENGINGAFDDVVVACTIVWSIRADTASPPSEKADAMRCVSVQVA